SKMKLSLRMETSIVISKCQSCANCQFALVRWCDLHRKQNPRQSSFPTSSSLNQRRKLTVCATLSEPQHIIFHALAGFQFDFILGSFGLFAQPGAFGGVPGGGPSRGPGDGLQQTAWQFTVRNRAYHQQ